MEDKFNKYESSSKEYVIDVETGKQADKRFLSEIIASYKIENDNIVPIDYFYSSMGNKYPIIVINNTSRYFCKTLIGSKDIIEDLTWGMFYHISKEQEYKTFISTYYRGANKYRIYKNKYPNLPEKTNNYLLTGNKKYTFGVELETASGFIPEFLDWELNMSCEYDGSLRPEGGGDPISGEYVTGVLEGNNGIFHLQKICNELSKRCTVDKKCGLHIHIGNLDFNKSFIVYAYKLALIIQQDLFKYLPPSRSNSVYCQYLPPIYEKKYLGKTANKIEYDLWLNGIYNEIFEKATRQNPNAKVNKKTQHPRGAKVGYDHGNIRYGWLNFIPCLCNTRENGSYTLEFRCHNGTTNFTKVKNWLMFCIAFVNFVENYQQAIENEYLDENGLIEKISIPLLLRTCFGAERSEKLISYFEKRRELFTDKDATAEEKKEYGKQKLNSIKELTLKEISCV